MLISNLLRRKVKTIFYLFCDHRICIKGDEFEACVFRKSANTDGLLNFSAMCSVAWKRGIILGSLNRGKLICSSPKLFNEEVNNLRWMFKKNGYKQTFLTRFLAYLRKGIAVELYWLQVRKRTLSLIKWLKSRLLALFPMNLKTNWLIYFSKILILKFFPFSQQQNLPVSFLWNHVRPKKSLQMMYTNLHACAMQAWSILARPNNIWEWDQRSILIER